MTTPHLTFDAGVLLLVGAITILLALLGALLLATYGLMLWAGWERTALFAHRCAERMTGAAMVIALGGYAGAVAW
jgi:sorbitol-specific phosphotransferase system component IIC